MMIYHEFLYPKLPFLVSKTTPIPKIDRNREGEPTHRRGGSREPGHTRDTVFRLRGSCSRRGTEYQYPITRSAHLALFVIRIRPHTPTDTCNQDAHDTIHQFDDTLMRCTQYLNGYSCRLFVAHCTSLDPNALGGPPPKAPRHRPDVASMSDVIANGEHTCG